MKYFRSRFFTSLSPHKAADAAACRSLAVFLSLELASRNGRVNTVTRKPQHKSYFLGLATIQQLFGLDGVGIKYDLGAMFCFINRMRIIQQILKDEIFIANSQYQFRHFHFQTFRIRRLS